MLFYKVQIHCQENLNNTDFVVMICFALSDLFMFPLQKLPEVLDLGDIDLDRKRLRKQLQVVRIMNCIWQLSITSFFFKKSQNPFYRWHQHYVNYYSVGFQKSVWLGSSKPPCVRPGTPAGDGPPEDFTICHCYLCQRQEVCDVSLFKS